MKIKNDWQIIWEKYTLFFFTSLFLCEHSALASKRWVMRAIVMHKHKPVLCFLWCYPCPAHPPPPSSRCHSNFRPENTTDPTFGRPGSTTAELPLHSPKATPKPLSLVSVLSQGMEIQIFSYWKHSSLPGTVISSPFPLPNSVASLLHLKPTKDYVQPVKSVS